MMDIQLLLDISVQFAGMWFSAQESLLELHSAGENAGPFEPDTAEEMNNFLALATRWVEEQLGDCTLLQQLLLLQEQLAYWQDPDEFDEFPRNRGTDG